MSFRHDLQHLSPQARHTIESRENNGTSPQNNSYIQNHKPKSIVYPTAIFMRLGHTAANPYDGKDTLEIYFNFCNKNQSVWFSTDSLTSGMSENKRAEFVNEIKSGNIVEIYFAIGKTSGGDNDIHFKADVVDIKTDGEGIPSPDKSLTPDEWKQNRNKIWIKIKNLNSFNKLTTKDFVVASSKKILADSISNSQFNFGYIIKKINT